MTYNPLTMESTTPNDIEPETTQIEDEISMFYKAILSSESSEDTANNDPKDDTISLLTLPDGPIFDLLDFDSENSPIPAEKLIETLHHLAETGQYPPTVLVGIADLFWEKVSDQMDHITHRKVILRSVKAVSIIAAVIDPERSALFSVATTLGVWECIDQMTVDPMERKVAYLILQIELFRRLYTMPHERKPLEPPALAIEKGYDHIWRDVAPLIKDLLDMGVNQNEMNLILKKRLHRLRLNTVKGCEKKAGLEIVKNLNDLKNDCELLFETYWSNSEERKIARARAEAEYVISNRLKRQLMAQKLLAQYYKITL